MRFRQIRNPSQNPSQNRSQIPVLTFLQTRQTTKVALAEVGRPSRVPAA